MTLGSPLPALRLLTRLPLAFGPPDDAEAVAASVGYFPLVGLALGAMLALLDALLGALLDRQVVDALLLLALALATGLFHLDGLMDRADGLLAPVERERRLEIMRDSHAGAFGVAALALMLLIEYAALGALPAGRRGAALLLMGISSRWSALALAGLFPYARPAGTGKAVHDGATPLRFALGTALAGVCAGVVAGADGVAGLGWVAIVSIGFGWLVARRLGGLTGDVYGAGVVVAESASLIAAPLLLTPHG